MLTPSFILCASVFDVLGTHVLITVLLISVIHMHVKISNLALHGKLRFIESLGHRVACSSGHTERGQLAHKVFAGSQYSRQSYSNINFSSFN